MLKSEKYQLRSVIMDNDNIGIARANIHFSDLYQLIHHCYYAFDIMFENPSTIRLSNLIGITAGTDREKAEEFLNSVKNYFHDAASIYDGCCVAVLFSGLNILAIGSFARDAWIDIRDGIIPCATKKNFSALGINITSLKVY